MNANVRKRGFTVLEVLVATSVLSILVVGAAELVVAGQTTYTKGTSHTRARNDAQRALDACVRELRSAAAWTLATTTGSPPGSADGSVTELTSWDEATSTVAFSFSSRTNLMFHRVVDAGVVDASMPPYVVFDFEPKGLGTGRPFEDANANGTTLAGRMDDDQLKARVLLRTRSVEGRIVLERVFAPAVEDSTLPESIVPIADLGPDRLPAGFMPGAVLFKSVGQGVVEVRVTTRAVSDLRGKADVTAIELATHVHLGAIAPPR